MSAATARETFRTLLARPAADVPLAETALTFAREAYPELDPAAYLAQLDALGDALRSRLRADISPADAIVALNHYLFGELGFAGNAENYSDPRNSYLNDVIDRRLGIPVTLSVVYIELGRRIGLQLDGVSFPGHFLVRCSLPQGIVILDPYDKGASLGVDALRRRVRELRVGEDEAMPLSRLLVPAPSTQIIVRMLRNLYDIHALAKAWRDALWVLDYLLLAEPKFAPWHRERGTAYLQLECFQAALADFERYLMLAPDVSDAVDIRCRVAELRHGAARLN